MKYIKFDHRLTNSFYFLLIMELGRAGSTFWLTLKACSIFQYTNYYLAYTAVKAQPFLLFEVFQCLLISLESQLVNRKRSGITANYALIDWATSVSSIHFIQNFWMRCSKMFLPLVEINFIHL